MEELKVVVKRMKITGYAFLAVITIGTFGFKAIGGSSASYFDGFYMTAITITTIGYTEIIELNDFGRGFAIFIAFTGIGVLTYFLTNMASLFIEGDLIKSRNRSKMEKKVAKMEGHYIVCGGGRVGSNIARELAQTEREFVIADVKEEVIKHVDEIYPDVPCLVGDCTDDDFLISLGVERAIGIFVTTGSDNINLVICVTARQLNHNIRIVAQSKDVSHVNKMRKVGANKVVSPTFIGGLRMASEMVRPTVTTFLDEMLRSHTNPLRIEEVGVPSSFSGRKLEDIHLDDCENTLILALQEGDRWVYNPKKDHVFVDNTRLIAMTTPKERHLLLKKFD